MCDVFCLVTWSVGLFVLYKLVDRLLRLPRINRYSDRYILVTGCDSGFGFELAKRLDSLGCHVFAGCLTESGETRLRKSCTGRVLTIPLDVSMPDSVRKASQTVSKKLKEDDAGLFADD